MSTRKGTGRWPYDDDDDVKELDLDSYRVVSVPRASLYQNGYGDDSSTAGSSKNRKKKDKKKKEQAAMATVGETFGFAFDCGPNVSFAFGAGVVGGFLNGLVYPALAYVFSTTLTGLSSAAANGLGTINRIAFTFLIVGAYALVTGLVQTWAFEVLAYHASQNFRKKYFHALLRQDQAFYDVYDVGGIASQVEANASKYRRGIGRKFGEGIEFATTGVFGLGYALYSSWRVALVVLAFLPVVSVAAMFLMTLNQAKGAMTTKSYKQAGATAYSAVAAVKTVLSLNAVTQMVESYKEATRVAYSESMKFLLKLGFANGTLWFVRWPSRRVPIGSVARGFALAAFQSAPTLTLATLVR
jgi:ATP-binding cassette subfamily B (MDR/TAP) protein 1